MVASPNITFCFLTTNQDEEAMNCAQLIEIKKERLQMMRSNQEFEEGRENLSEKGEDLRLF